MNATTEQPAVKRGRGTFWLLLAVCGIPYLAGWIYFANMDALPVPDTTNRGTLISPVRPIGDMELYDLAGNTFTTAQLQGKWVLLTLVPGDCDQQCARNLFFMRQVRRLMGEDRNRIERLALLSGSAQASLSETLKHHEGMYLAAGPGGALATLKEELRVDDGEPTPLSLYILDPLGNLMMYYVPDTDPKDVAKDLRRLLKLSRMG